MMKLWLTGAVAAPLLIACASAGAQTAAQDAPDRRVLIVNGEAIVLNDGERAADAIAEALSGADDDRLRLEFEGLDEAWSQEDREAFAEALAGLAEAFGQDFSGAFDLEFDFDAEDFAGGFTGGRNMDVVVRRIEREAERNAERLERQAERMARAAERMAEDMGDTAARAELYGLRAGVRGMESGLRAVEQVLERGWYVDGADGAGERVELSEDKRAELEQTRLELSQGLEDLRADLSEAEAGHGERHREIRIVRRNDAVRGWVDGEEVTGSELDRLLDGAPDAPEPPSRPD
jgi:hypothetical protein